MLYKLHGSFLLPPAGLTKNHSA